MNPERILVTAAPAELRGASSGAIDVYDALGRQFFWADTVVLGPTDGGEAVEPEVLEGEVVG